MIKLRYKPLKSGRYSLYLDIYTSDEKGNQNRRYEFLSKQVSKDYSKLKNIVAEDKETMIRAEATLRKRELEVTGELNGLKPRQKSSSITLMDYLEENYLITGDRHIPMLQSIVKRYTNNQDALLMDITLSWIDGFKDFLLKNVSQVTAYGYMSLLRARINVAYRQETLTINPFSKFVMIKRPESDKPALDVSEVEALIRTPFQAHPQLRLAFLFSCFTGLRVSDLYALCWKNIICVNDRNGRERLMMELKPIKTKNTTGETLKVPLAKAALTILGIIKKDRDTPGTEQVFNALPHVNNARPLLKIWAAKAGIKKEMRFHIARHTFATIGLTYEMDIYTVSKLLGHADVRTTEIYGKIVDEKKRTEIKKLPMLKMKQDSDSDSI
jgi:integrase